MNLTKEEVLTDSFKRARISKGWTQESKECVLDAMDEYAQQEAKSFAHWLAYQELGSKTIDQLWNEYLELFN